MKAKSKAKKVASEKVAIGEWVADVKTRKDKYCGCVRRKVETTGIVQFSDCRWDELIENLRMGRDVRLTHDGEEVLRFFPCLGTDFKQMYVVAQTMGSLRHSLDDIRFHIGRRDGASVGELRAVGETLRENYNYNKRQSVSPDTMVTCPNCGTEFRVGKQLT